MPITALPLACPYTQAPTPARWCHLQYSFHSWIYIYIYIYIYIQLRLVVNVTQVVNIVFVIRLLRNYDIYRYYHFETATFKPSIQYIRISTGECNQRIHCQRFQLTCCAKSSAVLGSLRATVS